MRIISAWLIINLGVLVTAGIAEERAAGFRGAVPGKTTVDELRRSEKWGQGELLKTVPGVAIQNVFEYRPGKWPKILVAVSPDQIVQTIEVTPPDRARAEDLARVLGLGQLIAVKSRESLPPGAWPTATIPDRWQAFRCSGGSGVLLFAEPIDGKRYARLLRFYASRPGDTPGRKPPMVERSQEEPTVKLAAVSASHRQILKVAATMLPSTHFSGVSLDGEIRARTIERLLARLDPRKLYFTHADAERFADRTDQLADDLKTGEPTLALEVVNTFRERIRQRHQLLAELLQGELEFSEGEYFEHGTVPVKFSDVEFETRDRWRRYAKYLLLTRMSSGATPDQAREQVHQDARRMRNQWNALDADHALLLFADVLATAFDPHSKYIGPQSRGTFAARQTQQFAGIGASLVAEAGFIVVRHVLPGGPANADGRLQAGDRILAVAPTSSEPFVDLADATVTQAIELIRGKQGQPVVLRVLTPGTQQPATFEITRGEIRTGAVAGTILTGAHLPAGRQERIGYIRVPTLYRDQQAPQDGAKQVRSATADVRELLERFRQSNVDLLVMDLRGNAIGRLDEAAGISGLLIDQGPIVQVKDREGKMEVLRDREAGMAWSGPLVLLTDRYTRGVSEIIPATVRDYGRGLIVGDARTYGKGTIQQTVDLGQQLFRVAQPPSLGLLLVTVKQLYRINGESLQQRGVRPHVVLPSAAALQRVGEETLAYAIDFDRIQSAVVNPGSELSPAIVKRLGEASATRRNQSAYFQAIAEEMTAGRADRVSLQQEQFSRERRGAAREADTARDIPDLPGVKLNSWLEEALTIAADYAAGS